jgi:3-dehydroquinate synthase
LPNFTKTKNNSPQKNAGQSGNVRMDFTFGGFSCGVHISRKIPLIEGIAADFAADGGEKTVFRTLLVCDENTAAIADTICSGLDFPRCVLPAGESAKNWASAEKILCAARDARLGRDGVIIGVGGGVVSDLAAFAASVYMRGCGLALVSTTLLGMADASIGGKTGFDLDGIKNLAGTFYPARHVYMPLESLASLPQAEWKSGFAEIIKTAILDGDDFLDELETLAAAFPADAFAAGFPAAFAGKMLADGCAEPLTRSIRRAAAFKGKVVESDPRETAGQPDSGGLCRALLNLGHTFGHALESSAGLGTLSHGEAVAWGIARACELGQALGVTPPRRAEKIRTLLAAFGYEIALPHPLMQSAEVFFAALTGDKKKKNGRQVFIAPDEKSARLLTLDTEEHKKILARCVGVPAER